MEIIAPQEVAKVFQPSPHTVTRNGQAVLASYTLPCPDTSLINFLRRAAGTPRVYWESEGTSLGFAGYGMAAVLMAAGPDRFQAIRRGVGRLFENAVQEVADAPPPVGPRLFGGFSFQPEHTPQGIWAAFPAAYFVLPRYQLTRFEDRNWLTVNRLVSGLRTADCGLRTADRGLRTWQVAALNSQFQIRDIEYVLGRAMWHRLVEAAIRRIHRGELDKVVLARTCDVQADQPIQPTEVLVRLQSRYPDCYRFLIEPVPGHVFFGATPELLVEVGARPSGTGDRMLLGNSSGNGHTGLAIHTVAMAGSIGRGDSPKVDAALGQELMVSPKERQEHAFVVDAIEASLRPLATTLEVPDQPTLRRLRNIQHLQTTIRGELASGYEVLSAVEALHPTPAVGGVPRTAALQVIAEEELLPRGWYASPVGWMDAQGNGLFAVAIRSAVSVADRARLYAGAGIVADSDPEREWAETGLKFRPMLEALGGLGDR